MLATTHPGMQAEAVRIGTQAHRGQLVPAGHGAQAQHCGPSILLHWQFATHIRGYSPGQWGRWFKVPMR